MNNYKTINIRNILSTTILNKKGFIIYDFDTNIHTTGSDVYNLNFKYNNYIKSYEDNLLNINNENELINYYSFKEENIKNPYQKNYITDTLQNFTGSSNSSSVYYYTDNNIKQYNSNKEELPFYSYLIFDNIIDTKKFNTSLNKIFEEFSLHKICFKYFQEYTGSYIDARYKSINLDDFFINEATKYVTSLSSFYLQLINFVDKNKISKIDVGLQKKHYSEIIGYKIIKTDINKKIIQTFYIPNSIKQKTNILDFQIKYNKKYTYKLYYLVATIANIYDTELAKFIRDINNLKEKNSVFFFEGPGQDITNLLLDNPPTKPDADFIPYISVPNKIKINLTSGTGEATEEPVILNSSEQEIAENLKQAQQVEYKLKFKNEEPVKKYEAYRIDFMPKTYEEFISGIKYDIPSNGSGASFEDQIVPNRKYYYIFRSFDQHDHFSNPTDVYILEMVSDNGVVYPILDIKKINELKNTNFITPSRTMKRFLSIQPSYPHRHIDPADGEDQITDKNEMTRNLKIGQVSPSVWDRKFKIRVTSKSTGKKIDINVVFDIKRNISS